MAKHLLAIVVRLQHIFIYIFIFIQYIYKNTVDIYAEFQQ